MKKWWQPHFKTKKQIEEKIRSIVASVPTGNKIGDIDKEFMLWVFSHHDEYEEKLGCGLQDILVTLDSYGNKRFVFKRVDGSVIDISWVYALTNKSSGKKFFIDAIRHEVSDQISEFRKNAGNVCGICGKQISGVSHVDHVIPFRELVSDFFGDAVHETIDRGDFSELDDRVLADSWKDFHRSNARLQISHASCNIKKG